ncbi:MAG TPA: HAD-IIIA family hydrolase [Bryobacteraceae bacterium]|nr:HAD-IIIA family hydrolase [Bryobacteraceae bacterium]
MKRAIFLDRDGTIVHDAGYLRDETALEPLSGALAALRELSAAGWLLIVVTNQSGVGRGLISMAEMLKVKQAFENMMRGAGAPVAASYCCIHAPEENCACRKPSASLFFQAARENGVDLRQSWMIGDRESDISAGKNAGCSTIWLKSNVHSVNPELPDFIAADWAEILQIIGGAVPPLKEA